MVDATPKLSQPLHILVDWQPSPPDNLIFDDGEPLETHRHRVAMNLQIRSLPQAMAIELITSQAAICSSITVVHKP